jgi:SAM-dependent methyltransferase
MEENKGDEFDPKTYWEKRLKKDYSLHGVGYIGHGEAYNKWMYKVRRKVFRRTLNKLGNIHNSAWILDVGSGTGFYIDLWKSEGFNNLIGLDLTEVAVRQLEEKFPDVFFYQVDISGELIDQISEKKFQVISIFDVLFHIVDDDKFNLALKNIHDILDDGGYFIFTDNFIHAPTYRSKHHVSRNIKEFYSALEKAGFEVISRKPAFVLMNAPVDARGKFIPWLWRFQEKLIYRNHRFGNFFGFVFYPLELILTRVYKEGPSTEIVVCRKIRAK